MKKTIELTLILILVCMTLPALADQGILIKELPVDKGIQVQVTEVTSGNILTINWKNNEYSCRLAGIEVPEPMSPSKPVEQLSNQAISFLSDKIMEKTVEIFLDDRKKDVMDNNIIWITGENGKTINEMLLEEGLGLVNEEYLNTPAVEKLKTAQKSAREKNKGIFADNGATEYLWNSNTASIPIITFPMSCGRWGLKWGKFILPWIDTEKLPEILEKLRTLRHQFSEMEKLGMELKKLGWIDDPVYSIEEISEISYKDAEDYIGAVAKVRGTIVSGKNTGKAIFLNFDKNWQKYLTLVIFASDLKNFKKDPLELYKDKKVVVTGRIKDFHGKPELIISSEEQIKIIEQ